MYKTVLTTGDIAKMFDVNINTVVKWFESGELEGYFLPGSKTRRVPKKKLFEFLAKRKFQVEPPAEARAVEILLVSSHPGLVRQFRDAIKSAFGYDLHVASCAFEAGFLLSKSPPDALFVHIGHTDLHPDRLRKVLSRRRSPAGARLVAVLEGSGSTALPPGFHSVLRLPTNHERILDLADEAAALASA